MSKIVRNEDAFTGLEAAIVLIAFVVVAAVFSYVVLGAGFFTTQKSQEVVHTGVDQASSSLELSGPVTVLASGTDTVEEVYFFLQVAAGGTALDMSKVTYTVSTAGKQYTYVDADSDDAGSIDTVTRAYVGPEHDTDDLLESLEMVQITVATAGAGGQFIGTDKIDVNDKFTIEVKPDKGAALPIERTAPAAMTDNNYYEVY
ncbi:flagellin [Methanoculleus taiwanensis]|uniref:Flagellin n=1 Tax=Methanoculleus taiwanensis TaxID=1550565 RepID=A0A498GYR7_9EURY|nr:archaellin/type IV pilin N-terminal domain-containing protein [Methanoculleus taiwanensis]RXE55297.1 flagellin [Methanoculleus taiwanensis]